MKVLQFGGGKDSLACLYLLEKEWPTLTVAWLNTGMAFPETIELMDKIRVMVPHFLEIKTDVASDIERFGWPSDLVPTADTDWGRMGTGSKGLMIRPWVDCCGSNFWVPLDRKMKEIGATVIVRGQRNSEAYKSPIRHGFEHEGVRYEFPLQDWSEEQVFAYLKKRGVEIPAYYQYTKSSLDCWNCTAYLDAKDSQLNYMKSHHPEKHAVVMGKLRQMRKQIAGPLATIDACLN